MDKNTNWYLDEQMKRTKTALEKCNYEVYIEENAQDMINRVTSIIEDGSVVSFGGSMTLIESGLLDKLHQKNINLLDRYKQGLTADDIGKLYRETFFADYYISSTNAITENGELVNMDGTGNRVAALTFGPRKLIIIAGSNKIARNLDEAYSRVRQYASPVNARRISRKTPCTVDGKCHDCSSNERICNHYVVTYRQNVKGRGIVILVKEKMGY